MFYESIAAWQCFFAIGVVLMLLELCLPAFFLLWIGVACLFTALTLALFVFEAIGQMLCFSVFSVISLIVGHLRYARRSGNRQVSAGLNDRSSQLIGQVFTLENDVFAGNAEHEKCHINIDDTRWSVRGARELAINAGCQVRIVAIKGNTLMVDVI